MFGAHIDPPPPPGPLKVVATAWPSAYRDDEAYFRCRVWDARADSAPFYVWASRHLLSGAPGGIIEALAAGAPEAQEILARALAGREEVEFNQTTIDPQILFEALGRISAPTSETPAT
jgi:hypothetical protein